SRCLDWPLNFLGRLRRNLFWWFGSPSFLFRVKVRKQCPCINLVSNPLSTPLSPILHFIGCVSFGCPACRSFGGFSSTFTPPETNKVSSERLNASSFVLTSGILNISSLLALTT